MLRVGSIVIRVDDLERQARFWEKALHYVRRIDRPNDFVLLAPRDGAGPNVSLDRVRSDVHIPPRIHLDLYADDQAAKSNGSSALAPRRCIGTGDRRMPTTSSSPTPRAIASASSTLVRSLVR